MSKVFIIGKLGKMGQLVEKSLENAGHNVVGDISLLQKDLSCCNPDIAIDFSAPELTMKMLPLLKKKNIPLISGTTGFSAEQLKEIQNYSKFIPIMYATNFSLGVNVLFELVKLGAEKLKEKSEVEIVEKHHRNKKDSPSGTAVTLGEIVAKQYNSSLKDLQIFGRSGIENKRKDEIAFHSLRGGNIVGEHSVQFILENELIELRHEALNRSIFADGAVSAIDFMLEKKSGFFHISDIL
jgi:4-hydroxy-tetrahydrodipicolinate reductase